MSSLNCANVSNGGECDKSRGNRETWQTQEGKISILALLARKAGLHLSWTNLALISARRPAWSLGMPVAGLGILGIGAV
jgi:hypothetical protein